MTYKDNSVVRSLIRNKHNIVFGLLFFTLVISYITIDEGISEKVFIGISAALITGYIGYMKFKIENDRVFKELFTYFNSKYDDKYNDIFNRLKSSRRAQLHPKEKLMVIDYFNLSAEEYLWYTKGRIPKTVWKAWKAGFIENLSIPEVKNLFENEIDTDSGKASYYGLHLEIQKIL